MQQSMRHGQICGVPVTYLDVYVGSGKTRECENCADDMQMRQTDKLQWMMSQMSHTKTIAQINHITESHGIG